MARVRWRYLVLYCAIAFALSVPFNTGLIYKWLNVQAAVTQWRSWLFLPAALGPLVAAIICYRLDRTTPRRIRLFGNDRTGSILVALIPLIVFTIAGYINGRARGLLDTVAAACVALFYSLGEEAGWRGYLQDALTPWSARQRYLLVGILWWLWHARSTNYFEWTVFPLIVIASAFVLGHVAEKTRSLLVVASMHSVIMLLTMRGSVSPAFGVAGVVIILGWILVGRLRPAKQDA
jgi:uncharacterized protein